MKSFTARKGFIIALCSAALLTIGAVTFVNGTFGYSSVCDRCGAMRQTTEWQIPNTEITLFARSSEATTLLSQALTTNSIVPAHNHNWLFAHGGGNGVRCALGSGDQIRWVVNSKDLANLLQLLNSQGQTELRDRVLRGIFDPDTSHMFRALGFIGAETNMTDAQLRTEVARELRLIEEMVAMSKQR